MPSAGDEEANDNVQGSNLSPRINGMYEFSLIDSLILLIRGDIPGASYTITTSPHGAFSERLSLPTQPAVQASRRP